MWLIGRVRSHPSFLHISQIVCLAIIIIIKKKEGPIALIAVCYFQRRGPCCPSVCPIVFRSSPSTERLTHTALPQTPCACVRVFNATFGKVFAYSWGGVSCRTGFFSLSINRATPSLATQLHTGQVQRERLGGWEEVREGGAGGASRYPAQGGAKGGGGINGSNSRSSQTCCSEGFPAVQVGTPQSMLLMTPLA